MEVVRAVMKSTEVPRSASLEHAPNVGCDKQRAGTPIYYATLFHHLGINVDRTTIADNNGRPQYLVEDGGKVMPEVV